MKTVIVSLNSQYIHSSLAVWYLFASAKSSGKNVEVIEGTVNEKIDDVYKRIISANPDIVAFSSYIWNIENVLILSERLKQKDIKILLGGPEVSYRVSDILKKYDFVDYIISGEGEVPFTKFLKSIEEGNELNIEGISYRNGKKIVISEPFFTDEIPINPYTKEYLESLSGRIAYIETSRGCPFSCAFCLSGRNCNVKYFPIKTAKNNIILLANSGSKIIKFVDRTFNADRKRAREILSFIIENYGNKIPSGVCFHFEIAGDLLKEEDFELLKKSPKGAIQFEIGLQSFNEETLECVNRKTNIKKLVSNLKKLISLKTIHTHIDLIAGLPKEDYVSFRNSFNTAFNLRADVLQLGFLKLIYGASLRDGKYRCSFTEKPPYEVTETPYLSLNEINYLKSCETSLDRFVNSGRFSRTVKYVFSDNNRIPFETLIELGMFTGRESVPLNDYFNKVYNYFKVSTNEDKLRDLLICDYCENVKSNILPISLKRKDKKLREFKNFLNKQEEHKSKKGIMRNVFLLYSENCGAYVDYDKQIDGKYKIIKVFYKTKEERY